MSLTVNDIKLTLNKIELESNPADKILIDAYRKILNEMAI